VPHLIASVMKSPHEEALYQMFFTFTYTLLHLLAYLQVLVMALSVAGTFISGDDEFRNNNNGDNDDDDDDDNDNSSDGPMTSQDGGGSGARRALPVSRGACAAGEAGRSRRIAVTQYVGQNHPSTSVLGEEERTTDDDAGDDVVAKSSIGMTTATLDDDLPHYTVDYPRGVARLRHSRTSLHGKPLNYRASLRETRLKRLQSRVYNFLERPKTCPSITYHTSV